MPAVARAVTSFATTVGEEEYVVHAGEVLPADHPVARAHPELFEVPVEQATAPERRRRKVLGKP
jgi:hypothetical protein